MINTRRMQKRILSFLLLIFAGTSFAQSSYQSLNINLISHIDPEQADAGDGRNYSGCWGWVQPVTNKEYAIVGSSTKTYFIDISNPYAPVIRDSVKGRSGPCTWRELTTYQHYCYVVSDVCTPNSFQIIDMQYLPDSVHVVYDDSTYFELAHTVRAYDNKLYVGGNARRGGTQLGMNIYSLANPASPVLLRKISQDFPSINYVHDMFARHDTIYASAAWQGLQVLKFNPGPNNLSILGSLTTYAESGYNHSSSLTPDGKTLIFCDETPNTSIKVTDVSNLGNISVSSLMRPNQCSDFVPHNPYVINDQWVYISCYQDGLMLYDISNPSAPVIKGFFDTYPQGGSGPVCNYGSSQYRGNWGAYPYFPSGVVLACDMQNGIFLLKPSTAIGVKEESRNALTASAYPNPASHELTITFANNGIKNAHLDVITAIGQNVISQDLTSDTGFPISFETLDLSGLANGPYFLTLTNGGQSFRQKFIISR